MNREFCRRRAEQLCREGQRLQVAGEVGAAVDAYTRSLEIYESAEAHTFLGWAYSFLGRYEQAIEECQRAVELDPGLGNPYNDIGSYLVKLGRLDEAIGWLEKAKEAPRYIPRHFPYINLGRIYAAKGLILRAIREFEGALRLCPGEASCVAALEALHQLVGEEDLLKGEG